jgi:hypothetical protein
VHQIRVRGLVREANRVRAALTRPLTAPQRDHLARQVDETLGQIHDLLEHHRMNWRHLPAPSRRAYQFLRELDVRNVTALTARPAADAPPDSGHTPTRDSESVSCRGLRAFLDRLLDDVAHAIAENRFDAARTHRVIDQTARRLEYSMRRDGLEPAHFKPQSRQLVGWFRHFADPGALQRYADAVTDANRIFSALPDKRLGWRKPLVVHFRPTSHLYRWRVAPDGTRIILATGMAAFDEPALKALARLMTGDRTAWPRVTTAMLDEPYQRLAVELEAADRASDQPQGVYHSLADAFARVNRDCFDSLMPRPRLSWTRRLTRTIFGHYDFIQDRLCVSRTLDHADVPAFVIDHVVHHELLHKKHGFRWHGHRQHTHTPEFRAEERSFIFYKEANRFLERLARDR